jgi:integrase
MFDGIWWKFKFDTVNSSIKDIGDTMGKLTSQQAKTAKPKESNYKLADGGGMYLYVTKTGKYWRYDYRFSGLRKTLALGVYPDVSLKQARESHYDARDKVSKKIDPALYRKITKHQHIQNFENNFENLAWEWFSKQNWTDGHARTVKGRLKNKIVPWLGNMPVNEITAQDVLQICRRIEDSGKIETAHRVKTICSQIFKYCVALGLIDSDPCRDLAKALTPAKTKNMACITDPVKVGGLMRAIDGYKGSDVVRAALKLAPLVFVRPGELRHAEWSEIDFDRSLWKIPAVKMKMKQPHIVPLCNRAVEIIKDIKPLTGNGRYIFPSIRSTDRPMSDNTILSALRQMGYPKEEMTGHGFRGMASTLLHEKGWDSIIIERQLAHSDSNSVRGAYNHAVFLSERKKMMQEWSDYLDELKSTI